MLDLNPLDVLNQRFLKFIPPHFAKMRLSKIDFQINEIKDWIDYSQVLKHKSKEII